MFTKLKQDVRYPWNLFPLENNTVFSIYCPMFTKFIQYMRPFFSQICLQMQNCWPHLLSNLMSLTTWDRHLPY